MTTLINPFLRKPAIVHLLLVYAQYGKRRLNSMKAKRGTLRSITREFLAIQQDMASCNRCLKNRIQAIDQLAAMASALNNQWNVPTFDDYHPGITFESDKLFE